MIFGICGRQENAKALKCTVVASEGIVLCKSRCNSWLPQLCRIPLATKSIRSPQRNGQIYQLKDIIIIKAIIIIRMPPKAAPSAVVSQFLRKSDRTPKPRV